MPLPDNYKLLHTTEILTEPPLVAKTYQAPHRYTGRRIVVEDRMGKTLFDTGDHYDIGNACNAIDRWANIEINAGRMKPQRDLVESRK